MEQIGLVSSWCHDRYLGLNLPSHLLYFKWHRGDSLNTPGAYNLSLNETIFTILNQSWSMYICTLYIGTGKVMVSPDSSSNHDFIIFIL